MSTNAIIGTTAGEGFRGRYCHWDGYPTWMGPQLASVVHDLCDGDAARAVEILTVEHAGWSNIDTRPGKQELPDGYRDGRFASVPGVGIAYTIESGQTSEDEWYVFPGSDLGSAEWAYAFDLEAGRLCVFRIPYGADPIYAGSVQTSGLWLMSDDQWGEIEGSTVPA